MLKIQNFFLCLGLISSLVSCGEPETSSPKYGIYKNPKSSFESFSTLYTLQRTQGTLNVVLSYKNFDEPIGIATDQMVKDSITRALSDWNNALAEHPDWTHKNLRVNFVDGDTDDYCTKDDAVDYQSTWWECRHEDKIKIVIDQKIRRSYANMWHGMLIIEGQRVFLDASDFYKLVLHEYGHLLGLADTYNEPGRQELQDQPQAIMNNLWLVDGLQRDDEIGIRALWSYLDQDAPYCKIEDGYGSDDISQGLGLYCVPLKDTSTIELPQHGTLTNAHSSTLMHASSYYKAGPGKEIYQVDGPKNDADVYIFHKSRSNPGYYKMISRRYNTCVHGSSTQRFGKGFNVYHRACDGSDGDYWKVKALYRGNLEFRNKANNLCLRFSKSLKTSAQKLQIYLSSCDENQETQLRVTPE
ncbi:hypothetical protein [Pseudobacteriovorax antillogorgiicola]|uniref:Uncharacterized protein n=1 Tax=Pseudobacteriovorax antillogorgiicola TaxID=1513793 RepID=A0A1Y6BIE5_9BACT|nr:hypothetical protein [Pseudobacteriovorax antillogorgiicola]TCS56449.1 hypothetical protein EDD56_104271 [Pseudobacteriovorax antillogorgiicola]SMF05323.1 hypothetical protein SAMN06296036_10462 [Pseudobacteriovorax antillogorgiicola]